MTSKKRKLIVDLKASISIKRKLIVDSKILSKKNEAIIFENNSWYCNWTIDVPSEHVKSINYKGDDGHKFIKILSIEFIIFQFI